MTQGAHNRARAASLKQKTPVASVGLGEKKSAAAYVPFTILKSDFNYRFLTTNYCSVFRDRPLDRATDSGHSARAPRRAGRQAGSTAGVV